MDTIRTDRMHERVLQGMIDALEALDDRALASMFADDVRFRASLPRRDIERTGRGEAAAAMVGWFADTTDIACVHSAIDTVGDVWHAGHRVTVRHAGGQPMGGQ